jgi:hypothetical protein
MSKFSAWNALLLSEFFSPVSAQDPVWLHTTRDELDSFGIHLGGAAGLIDAVRARAPWLPSGKNTCAEEAAELVRQRTNRFARASHYVDPGATNSIFADARAPTYLPILALWVLASSEVQDKGFYATVASLLGQDTRFPNTPVVTAAMSSTWQDLEKWSSEECVGRFGIFKRRVLGAHCYVGMPRSQCLIGRTDERNIKRLFAESHLRPGEQITQKLLARLLSDGQDAEFLSKALRDAMRNKEYADPLQTQLQRLLDSWDGLKPRHLHATSANDPHSTAAPVGLAEDEIVTLVLSQSDEIENGWDVRWRIQAPTDNRSCSMQLLGQSIPARFHSAETTFVTVHAERHRKTCTDALTRATLEPLEVVVTFDDDNSGSMEEVRRVLPIPSATRRILCWNTLDPQYGEYLVERDIPLFGPFYILSSPDVEGATQRWLEAERISFQDVPSDGLPASWRLACVPQAERLNEAQRQYIADTDDPTNIPRARIRLIGGRSLMRGGARIFAAYDLPRIDIEAPKGAHIEAPGLTLERVLPAGGLEDKATNERYVVRPLEDLQGVFKIKVLLDSLLIAETRLRIAYPDGGARGELRPYSMSNLGQSRIDEAGLRGATIGTHVDCSRWHSAEQAETKHFDNDIDYQIEDLGVTKFLNSLARVGTIAYASARDELRRLCADADPMPLLMDLRARGCLEIQTDPKGHVVRIHSVSPVLYELPLMFDGFVIAGVAGTLTLPQWAQLRASNELMISASSQGRGFLPAVRVAAESADKLREACEAMEFDFSSAPAKSIAAWSGSVEDAQRTFVRDGWEHFSAKLSHLHRMKWDTAQLIPTTSEQMTIERQIGAQLFRFDDPQAWPLQLYVLGTRDQTGSSRYSHIHDSRWGAWISVLALARLMHDTYGQDDALPWPIQYDPITRDLWLPARMRPPAVLERALCLCSGSSAEVVFLEKSEATNDRLPMMDRSNRMRGYVSRVYSGFFPANWLRFRDVPAEVAAVVASRLGGRLDSIAATTNHDLKPMMTA